MENKKNWKRWIYWCSLRVPVIFVYKTLDSFTYIMDFISNLFNLMMPFVMAIIIAYLFYIPARSIERTFKKSKLKLLKKHARGISVFTVYLIALILLVIIINFVLPAVYESISELVVNLPNYYNSAINFVNDLPEESFISREAIQNIIANLQKIDFSTMISPENISNYLKRVLGIANTLFDMFVTLVVSVYILLERGEIKRFFSKLNRAIFDKKVSDLISEYSSKTNEIFFKFISSQVLDGILVGILTSIAMSIMGVKYSVLLGFLIGILNIIPYFGAIIGVGLSILITIFTGGFAKAIWLAIVVIIIQQIDANIINPRILGNSLKVSPILVIFSVTVGGAYFGVLGMFLAVPVVAIIKIILLDYIEYKNSKNNIY